MLRIRYRLVLVALSALLAMPAALPVETANSAKRKRFKTVTQTFTQEDGIDIPAVGSADPYPSPLTVHGFKKGRIKDVNLRLIDFSHDFSGDVEVLLVKGEADPVAALVMSDAGNDAAFRLSLTLDDEAAAALPDAAPLTGDAFRPTNHNDGGADLFPAPAPAPDGAALSVFDGLNPNGQWRLFVVDEFAGSEGGIAGWELEITARVKVKKKR